MRRPTTLSRCAEYLDVGAQFFDCVKRLEAKDNLFATYFYDYENEIDLVEHILENMNERLSDIFNCNFQELDDRSIAVVAIHAFYRSDRLLDKWLDCKFPLFSGLLVCYIMRLMRHEFESLHEYGLVELYKQSHDDFEDRVLELLEQSIRSDEKLTRDALKLKYTVLIRRSDCDSSACSVDYLLDLAMMAKCERILNHSISRRITNERWTPDISISRMLFIFSFFTVIPILFIPFNRKIKYLTKGLAAKEAFRKRQESFMNPNRLMRNGAEAVSTFRLINSWIKQKWKNIFIFYSSPCSNFCLHTTFYFVYITLYTSVLLRSSRVDTRFVDFLVEYRREMLLYLWQLAYIFDMIYSCLTIGFKKFLSSNPADLTHNFCNIIWIILVIFASVLHEFKIATWLWGILVVLSKLFFLASFIFSSIRIMRVFAADSFFGAIVVMMKKMVYTLWSFFIVFVLFWCTYAIAIVSLLEKESTTQSLPWNIFSNGAFEIFGELKEDMRDGKIEECPTIFNSTDIRDFTIDCAFRTWMIPVILFIYVLVSSVLLVNLVTSFFTNTFEQVKHSSMLHYRYKHYQRVVEFERKLPIPAPISIAYHLPLVILALIKCCCCCDCTNKPKDIEVAQPTDQFELQPLNLRSASFIEMDHENLDAPYQNKRSDSNPISTSIDLEQGTMTEEELERQTEIVEFIHDSRSVMQAGIKSIAEEVADTSNQPTSSGVAQENINIEQAIGTMKEAMEQMRKAMGMLERISGRSFEQS